MKISYNSNIPLVGIGIVPWARLGPENWFDNYQILSINEWDLQDEVDSPKVTTFKPDKRLKSKNVQSIVSDSAFERYAENMSGSLFIPYKAVEIDDSLKARMLMNDTIHAKLFENKAKFREMFAGRLNFAPHKIYNQSELSPDQNSYTSIKKQVGDRFVLQHESLTGGKGTHLINSYEEYVYAVSNLPAGKIVASLLIDNAQERSVQVCATRYGSIAGPIQKQIIRDPQICKLDIPDVRMFCGGEVGTVKLGADIKKKIYDMAKVVGEELYSSGYRGIFGLDTLVKGDEVYILEVNARLTGMTPLLTALYRGEQDIPFYLLHILELGNIDYEITDRNLSSVLTGSQMILQAHIDSPSQLVSTVRSGIYKYDDQNGLSFVRAGHRFRPEDDADCLLIQAYVTEGTVVKPAERIAVIFVRDAVLNGNDEITEYYRRAIQAVYSKIEFESIENNI